MKKAIASLMTLVFLFLSAVGLTSCGSVEYKVDFMVDGEVYETVTVNGEDTIVFPERPTKENYVFGGWYFDEGTWKEKVTSIALQGITSDIEVYAKFTRSQDGDSSGEEGGGQTNEGGTGGNPDQGADGINESSVGNGGTTPTVGNNGVDAKTETFKGFMVGNSLSMSISIDRLKALFASQYYNLEVDQQMSAGTTLAQHVGVQNAETGEYIPCNNYNKPKSSPGYTYFDAMATEAYDFASLQLYLNFVYTPEHLKSEATTAASVEGLTGTYYRLYRQGDFETITRMIDYALAQREAKGTGTNTFIIYQTWNDLRNYENRGVDTDRDRIYEFSEYYNDATYNTSAAEAGYIAATKAATTLLMDALYEYYEGTDVNIILANAGEILSVMDEKIKSGTMTGFETYMNRNSLYYLNARNGGTDVNMDGDYDDPGETSNPVSGMGTPLLQNAYAQEYGVLNLYTDIIHMCAYPHAGAEDGTLASYMTAMAMYTAITGNSPIGLPVDTRSANLTGTYIKRIDPVQDTALVRLVQEIVFDVMVDSNESITEDAPTRAIDPVIKSTFDESETATSKGKLTMTDDISGGNLIWREIETNSSINYSAMPLLCDSLGCIKINGRGTTRYLALDLTSYMTVGHEYDFSVQMQADLFVTDTLRGQLWIKLTKNDGTYELIKIAEEYITGDITQTGALKAVKGTYRHADETVTKVEILTNVQTLEGNNVTKYFFDNFRMWEMDEFTDVDITPVPAPLAE